MAANAATAVVCVIVWSSSRSPRSPGGPGRRPGHVDPHLRAQPDQPAVPGGERRAGRRRRPEGLRSAGHATPHRGRPGRPDRPRNRTGDDPLREEPHPRSALRGSLQHGPSPCGCGDQSLARPRSLEAPLGGDRCGRSPPRACRPADGGQGGRRWADRAQRADPDPFVPSELGGVPARQERQPPGPNPRAPPPGERHARAVQRRRPGRGQRALARSAELVLVSGDRAKHQSSPDVDRLVGERRGRPAMLNPRHEPTYLTISWSGGRRRRSPPAGRRRASASPCYPDGSTGCSSGWHPTSPRPR